MIGDIPEELAGESEEYNTEKGACAPFSRRKQEGRSPHFSFTGDAGRNAQRRGKCDIESV